MAVIEVRATYVLVSTLLGKKIDLRCLSLKSKKKCLLISLWSELGHMAIEASHLEMSLELWGPWDFQGISFLHDLLT